MAHGCPDYFSHDSGHGPAHVTQSRLPSPWARNELGSCAGGLMGRLYSTHADHIREDALHYPDCHDRGEANPERLFQGRDRSVPAVVPEADRPPERAP